MQQGSDPSEVHAQPLRTVDLMVEIDSRIRRTVPNYDERLVIERHQDECRRRTRRIGDEYRSYDHQLRPNLRLGSHRRLTGFLVTWIKKWILFPINRWFVELMQENFDRQRQINAEVLTSIEVLVLENAELRKRIEELHRAASPPECDQAESPGT